MTSETGMTAQAGTRDMQSNMQNESFAVQVERYNNKYNEIKERISEARKEGKDVFMADLHLASFKAKMYISEVTREQKDLNVVKRMLLDAEKELKEAEEEKIVNVKKEVEEGARKLIEEDAGEQA